MSRIAFFDLDDTLCDRGAAFARWLTGFCARYGLDEATARPVIDEFDQRGRGKGAEVLFHQAHQFGRTERAFFEDRPIVALQQRSRTSCGRQKIGHTSVGGNVGAGFACI